MVKNGNWSNGVRFCSGKILSFFETIFTDIGNQNIIHNKSYSAEIGILLVVFGLIISIFGYFRYKKTEKQINEDSFKNNSFLIGLSTIILIVFTLILIWYLITSVESYAK